MSQSAPSQHFLLGVVSTLAAVWVTQRLYGYTAKKTSASSSSSSKRSTTVPRTLPSANANKTDTEKHDNNEKVMDNPELENRIIRKAETVIQWRTSRITVVVERCTNDHNYSAILRTAEALGLQNIWIIDPPEMPTFVVDDETDETIITTTLSRNKPVSQGLVSKDELKKRAMHHLFARKANDWLTVREFKTTSECLAELRKTGHDIWVTDLSQEAVCLTKEGLTEGTNQDSGEGFALPPKLAIVFGTEAVGASDEMLQAADKRVYLPLRGFADSLNISVATALILHQLFVLDPTVVGGMPEEERRGLREKWFTSLCQKRLLTSKQKKHRAKLKSLIQRCEHFQKKQDNNQFLQPQEAEKLGKYEQFKKELDDLEEATHMKGEGSAVLSQAVQDLVDDPPEPMTDLRRADCHRVCFVGKNTKNKHEKHWQNMVAVTNYDTTPQEGKQSNFFRDRIKQAASSAAAAADGTAPSTK